MAEGLRPQQGQGLSQNQMGNQDVLSGSVDGVPPMMSNFQTTIINNRRGILFFAAAMMFVGFVGLMLWSSESPYRAVYSGMDEKDAAAIVELLQKEKIPYKLQGAGTVLVPEDQVYAVRLTLASADMAPGNGQGFEIFDRANEFGVSDFTQKVNLQRALQVELSRTIEVLPAVAAARVHLVLPKESAFAERDRKASASVMLKLTGNKKLPQQSVDAIQSLVASAVAELDRAAVTVVDSSGNMLSANEKLQPSGEGQSMMDYEARLETSYEARLTSMLEQVVGSGQAIVRVSADINREHVESNSHIFNPDEQVLRSSKAIDEKRSAVDATPMGVPGMASNNPDNVGADGALVSNEPPKEEASRSENTMNYEISSKTEQRITPFGTIEKLSIAVIVGGAYTEGENGVKTFVPRSEAELGAIQDLVRSASGFSEDRGDTVEVQSLPLHDISGAAVDDMDGLVDKTFYLELLRYGLGVLALLLVAWFIMRPMAKRIASTDEREQNALGVDSNGVPLPGVPESAIQMNRARAAILSDPNRASRVVQEWVS
ncbi:MAG: flagellar M-ring protein FliF [Zetaproteobacteria bacterium CG2_30_46_52]|nr:MAG: flagellar M-ring protein FliF [Zetaproteobacteria bacterium CG2_30_46_52]